MFEGGSFIFLTRFLKFSRILRDDQHENTKFHPAFMIAIHIGMRRNEVLGLTWDDVNFSQNTISITKRLQPQNKELI